MEGIKVEMTEGLKQQVISHKRKFVEIFIARYRELLPTLITYQNGEKTSIDFLKVEVSLRNDYNIVIGETKKDGIQVLGFANSIVTPDNPTALFTTTSVKKKDITFVIPKHKQLDHMKEISYTDDCKTGNFVVLKNKTLNYQNDNNIIYYYVSELAEIILSRYSLSMQMKIMTFFIGEHGDQTINEILSDMYQGVPFSKVTKMFDPEEQIIKIDNANASTNMESLKKEYQNKISELNNMLGINSLAVEKNSGVSDSEAKSNRSFTTSNANIYLSARNHALERLNKRYKLNIFAIYNDEVASEFGEVAYADDESGD